MPPPSKPSTASATPDFISPRIGRHRHFFANLSPSKAPGIVVACGGWEQCAEDYVVERKSFRFHAIEFVAHGRGELDIFGQKTPLFPGSLFSYGPKIPHRIRSDPREPLVKYFVDFSGRDAAGLIENLQAAGAVRVTRVERVQEWFEQLLDAGEQAEPDSARICALLTELIVRHAMAHSLRARSDADKNAARPRADAMYERCRATLRQHFLTLASASDLARACHIDVAYMTRLFQHHGSESPYQMLVRLKMNRAAEHLVTSHRTLKEIGEEVGYPDPYHFSRVFKRTFGMAPRTFRHEYHRI